MTEAVVTRGLLMALAERCAFPAIRLGPLLLADEGAWRYAVTRATPQERVQLTLALGGELLRASAGGRARLEAARHRPFLHEVDAEPHLRGDAEALPLIAAALALIPDEVRWPLVRETAFLSVGRSSRAWTGPAALIDQAGRRKARLIVLGPEADARTICHELAHAWNAGPPRDAYGITAQGECGLAAHAVKAGWSGRLAAWERAEEQLAEGLALSWLYGSPSSRPS